MSYDPRCYRCECRPCQCTEIARDYTYAAFPLENLREAGVVELAEPWNFGCTGKLSPKKLATILRVVIDDLEGGNVKSLVDVYVRMTEYAKTPTHKTTRHSRDSRQEGK